MTVDEIRAQLKTCPEWFHTIELAPGVVTPGRCSGAALAEKWGAHGLTDLTGRSVLDIGAYDGYFSFAAERAGATRVVALDHYVWSADMAGYIADWSASKAAGGSPLPAPHGTRHWDPQGLPGRRPFDLAHWEFFSGQELNNDASNWWAPNATALRGLCRVAGFRDTKILTPQPASGSRAQLRAAGRHGLHALGLGSDVRRYRLSAQARR